MFCPQCGAENKEGNNFCLNCGFSFHSTIPAPTSKIDENNILKRIWHTILAFFAGVSESIDGILTAIGIIAFIYALFF